MSLTYNGTEINQTSGNITYNGSTVKEVTMDGVSVWKKVTTKTYTITMGGEVKYWNIDLTFQVQNRVSPKTINIGKISKINSIVVTGSEVRTGLETYSANINKTGNCNLNSTSYISTSNGNYLMITCESTGAISVKYNPSGGPYPSSEGIDTLTVSLSIKITYTPAE